MDEAVRVLGVTLDLIARHALHRIARPVGAHVGENLRTVRQKLHEEHAETVQHVVLRREDVGLADAVPVEGGVEERFRKVAVRIEVRPLPLTLEPGGDGVVTHHFLFASLGQVRIAVHQVLDDDHHLHDKFPLLVLDFAGFLQLGRVLVKAFGALRLRPGERFFVFFLVVDLFGDAAHELYLVHGFHAHAEIFLDEAGIDDRAADAHRHRTDLQIGLAAHRGSRNRSAPEAEELFAHVVRDGGVVSFLHLMPVDAERRKTLLRMGGENGGEIDRARTLRAVEAPDRLDGVGIGVHGLGAVAPAGRHGEGDVHAFLAEFVSAGGGFSHASDGGVRDHDLHGLAIGVAEVVGEELCGGFRHVHRLILEGFTHLERTASSVDGRADADDRIIADESGFCHNQFLPLTKDSFWA